MPKKETLFLLIRSLTKSEKRYFKLHSAAGKSKTNYLQLFDVIDRQTEYNETAIRNHFKSDAFTNQLHVAKIYLCKMIMKSLRNYHTNSSVSASLSDLLRDIEILYRKELYDACWLNVEKAEKLALRYEKLSSLLEVLDWKRRLMIGRMYTNKITDAVLKSEKTAIGQLDNLNAYWNSTLHIFDFVAERSFLKDLDKKKPATLQALILHKHLRFSWYFMNGRQAEAETEISALISHLEKYPERVADDPGSYITAIGNKIGLLMRQKRRTEIEALIRKMRSVPGRYKVGNENIFKVRLWLRIFNLELEMYRDNRQLAKGIRLAGEVSQYLADHDKNIPDDYRIMLNYQIAGLYFMKKDFKSALDWVNRIINYNFDETRNELQCYARIMNLMIHFELDNIIVLRYAVESCRRFFKKKKCLHVFEQQVLLLFSRLSLARRLDDKVIFERSYRDIYGSETGQPGKIQDYIDLKGWIKGKMQRRIGTD